jgi:hypothetical protein
VGSGGPFSQVQTVTVNNVVGYPFVVDQADLETECECIDGTYVFNDIVTLNYCYSNTVCESGCFCNAGIGEPIDAVAICWDASMLPE